MPRGGSPRGSTLESSAMPSLTTDPQELLERSAASGRVHSAYLLSGVGKEPRGAALRFVRSLVCSGSPPRPCEACEGCRRSAGSADAVPVALDGTGKRGPLYRHVGDHADLLWTERDADSTRWPEPSRGAAE